MMRRGIWENWALYWCRPFLPRLSPHEDIPVYRPEAASCMGLLQAPGGREVGVFALVIVAVAVEAGGVDPLHNMWMRLLRRRPTFGPVMGLRSSQRNREL
jgi:hypothetical protein